LVESKAARREILEIRHSSLYAPRDFDISPYFEVVKPTIVRGFNYKSVAWADRQRPAAEATLLWSRHTTTGSPRSPELQPCSRLQPALTVPDDRRRL
jgi:hypothetical protein